MPRMQMSALLLSLATLSVPALAQGTYPAVRESSSALNFVQGQATLDGQPVTTNLTTAPRLLHPGDVLTTTTGSADVMLAPGSLMRIAQNTSIRIVADDVNRAEARLEAGHANVAVNLVRENSLLLVDLPQGQTQILKRGLYSFDVPAETARVYNGEADAFFGSDTNTGVRPVKVKDDHEVVMNAARLHATGFNREDAQEDLIPWTGPQETQAALADGALNYNGNGYGNGYGSGYYGGYYPAAYGFGYSYPYPYFAYGWPYGFYGYPWGGYGYPPFGIGFGYWGGWYGGRGVIGGAAIRGGFTAGGFHGGGFAGGGRR